MPIDKEFKKPIPAFYKSQAEDLLLFGFVEGIQSALPAVKIKSCIELFKKHYGLAEDEFPLDCAQITYQNMKRKFYELEKTKDQKQ